MSLLTISLEDLADAGALLRYALDPTQTPIKDPEYRRACERHASRPEVRDALASLATSLGLRVLEIDALYGAVVVPTAGSPFSFDPADFAPSSRSSATDRQRDGVLLLAILATAFPRRAAMVGDPATALPPFTLDEVLHTLEDALRRAEAAVPAPDVEVPDADRPLWAIVKALPEVRETPDGRAAARTRRSRCKLLLERLRERGAVVTESGAGGEVWRPTWRWQVQVGAFASGGLWASAAPIFWPSDAPTIP